MLTVYWVTPRPPRALMNNELNCTLLLAHVCPGNKQHALVCAVHRGLLTPQAGSKATHATTSNNEIRSFNKGSKDLQWKVPVLGFSLLIC